MLTQNEINSLSLSPTKKDFVQIWNELLEVAGKLSERWDPTSTNESDPGIVILKALTGIADKLNYNIDKNILEAFMPTAAQEDSMRKLCDMLGYNMKYYRSAEVDVTVKYYNPALKDGDTEKEIMENGELVIPKFTVITNNDKDISYFTTETSNLKNFIISLSQPSVKLHCMEGQLVKCESNNDNNVITASQISGNNRFYLPETMIAENGIFIYNVASDATLDGDAWKKVDNLNTQAKNSKVFKFGYDSYESRPYIEFPEDYSQQFGEGIFLYYTRTSGINGTVSPRTLTQIELPTTGLWSEVSPSSFSVENVTASTQGANTETIKQAYNNFKKTIGTFDTLVTCRDYMNKIYSYIIDGKPLVSNILVTDIRSDINNAITICSCDGTGIFYKDAPLSTNIPMSENTKPVFSNSAWHLGSTTGVILTGFADNADNADKPAFNYSQEGEVFVKEGYWAIEQGDYIYKTDLRVGATEPAINRFDLVFYPFKSYNQIRSNTADIRASYDASFNYADGLVSTITSKLKADGNNTISHDFKRPPDKGIVSINNYYRLSAAIATNSKVTLDEGTLIIDNIKKALANAFNMRELDFGDEIPFDSIVEVIENADTRIKVASLNEPALYTTFSVLERGDNPVVVEYAVASDWLDATIADNIGKFTKTNDKDELVSTFDTTEARKIYNKLAIRNILAGRVPLFDYNTAFSTSFSEGSYQETKILNDGISCPTFVEDNGDYTVWTENGIVYTKQLDEKNKPFYTETVTVYPDNLVTEKPSSDGSTKNYITDIKANCTLKADTDTGIITDVTLADGEFVKFRAPNFITTKTYPAYVNYHLDLAKEIRTESEPAVATSLFSLLNDSSNSRATNTTTSRWQKVLDYFGELDTQLGTSYKKTFTLAQTVSAKVEDDSDKINITYGDSSVTIGVGVSNTPIEKTDYTPESLVALSGCIKWINDGFRARIEWTPKEDEKKPSGDVPLELVLEGFTSPFITNVNTLAEMKSSIDTALETYRSRLPVECTKCSFTVYLDFECVPFEAKSLAVWEGFIKNCSDNFTNSNFKHQILDYKPYDEFGSVFWRMFGDGYEIGRYVTQNTEKLSKFSKNHFGLLTGNQNHLQGIYLVASLGYDAKPVVIKNNEEYKLRRGEYLYIEYTPSSTTDEGTTKDLAAVTEVYGEGTIIRPSGFEVGLMDSTVLEAQGTTAHKEVTFAQEDNNVVIKKMRSFGAKEQVEIRNFAEVTLSKANFSHIYVYKNFNGCPELENANGNQGSRTYTLKDGEAIFYTDQNKSEFAYYTTGTAVTLEGNVTINEFDIVPLSTVLDSGLQELQDKWQRVQFNTTNDAIVFQEYQYVTLGSGDTIKQLKLCSSAKSADLSDSWEYCAANDSTPSVVYTLAGDPETELVLPAINLHKTSQGNGWEARSFMELAVSQDTAQSLRKTDKIETSLTLARTLTTGGEDNQDPETTIPPHWPDTTGTQQTLSFKTNLACYAQGNKINIKDVWANPNKAAGFQVKVFVPDDPVLVETKPGTVAPYNYTGKLTDWSGTALDAKGYLDLWNQVNLEKIKIAAEGEACDKALRLSVSLLPNTYGIFCLYLDYTVETEDTELVDTWIEVIPGTKTGDISLLNTSSQAVEYLSQDNSERLSKLHLNPGINCIRINKSCKFFVKTSTASKGILYFDELRLVNSTPIKYKDATISTQGLNLKQIGYLDASDKSDALTKVAKDEMQKAYVDDMYSSISKTIQDTEEEFNKAYNELREDLPKVNKAVEVEKLVNEELKALSDAKTTDERGTKDRCSSYASIKDTLTKERELLAALKNNVKADELEQKLITLLDSFDSTAAEQQQILDELYALCTAAETTLENLTDDAVLNDFTGSSVNETAAAAIKTLAVDGIEKHYQKQLTAVSDSLNSSANSTSKATLLSILEKLKTTATADYWSELQTKVNELSNLVENEVNAVVEELVEATHQDEPDYAGILALLTQLRNVVSSNDIKVRVLDLSEAISNSDDTQVKKLLAPLFDANGKFDKEALEKETNSAIIEKIDDAEAAAIAAKKSDLQSSISGDGGLCTKIQDEYTSKLSELFESINSIITELQSSTESLDAILKSISETEYSESDGKNSKVQLAIASLNSAITERTELIQEIEGLKSSGWKNWQNNGCEPFIRDAVVEAWPAFMKGRLSSLLTAIAQAFEAAIAERSTVKEVKEEVEEKTSAETEVMKEVIPTEALNVLSERILALISVKKQNSNDTKLIKDLSAWLPDTEALTNALDAVSKSGINEIISNMILSWSEANAANDVKQKQKLQVSLKEALKKAIATNEQLFTVIANTLCPNLTKGLEELKELKELDNSYENFYNELEAIESALQTCEFREISDEIIKNDSDCLALMKLDIEKLRVDLLSESGKFDKPTTLLPDLLFDKINTLEGLTKKISTIEADVTILEGYKLSTMSSAELLDKVEVSEHTSDIFEELCAKISENIEQFATIDKAYEDAFKTLMLEEQLLADIRAIDTYREFYYNAPSISNQMIDFNTSTSSLNSLMSPLINYDVNNANNGFVISKLDIDFLDSGLKIARSSMIN